MDRKKFAQGTLDFEETDERGFVLPSPKRTRLDSVADGELPWGLAYAAFSRKFASAAVAELTEGKRQTVVDPFIGSGTTVEASLENGVSCIGVDLNPYSALTSRVRGVRKISRKSIHRILESIGLDGQDRTSNTALQSIDPVAALTTSLALRLRVPDSQLINKICAQKSDSLDNEIVALCSLTYAARLCANTSRGSNPTWTQSSDASIPIETKPELVQIANGIVDHMVESLGDRPRSSSVFVQVFSSDFSAARIPRGSIKRFLTSPPYLNRLDYVRSNLPEIQRLGPHTTEQIESLRASMMGTTKIRGLDEAVKLTNLSSLSANVVIDQIKNHPTIASATYYFQFFLQYFLDLERFFTWLGERSAKDAAGIIVLQDSYYKDLPIPLADIYREIATIHGFSSEVVSNWQKKNYIGKMSPTQRKHAPSKVLTESVILFKKLRSQ